jgi:hypothetical protein
LTDQQFRKTYDEPLVSPVKNVAENKGASSKRVTAKIRDRTFFRNRFIKNKFCEKASFFGVRGRINRTTYTIRVFLIAVTFILGSFLYPVVDSNDQYTPYDIYNMVPVHCPNQQKDTGHK